MASAGWDEVLGGGGVGEEPEAPDDGDDGDDGGGAPPPKKRVKTSTKVVLVAAGWLLLTLFLVGQFSKDKAQPSAVARLDTLSGADGSGEDGAEDELFEPEPVDTEEEALLDVDGDGFLSAAEQGITEGEAAASIEGGVGGGSGSSGGTYEGTAGGSSSGADGSTGTGNAVPGAAPTGSGSGSTSGGGTTSGGGSTGGSGSGGTTSTTAGGSGGGGGGTGSTTTTSRSGGGGTTTTTTTTASPTTSTTTTSPGGPVPSTATATWKGNTAGFDPASVTVRLSNGIAKVTITNDSNLDRDFRVEGGSWREIKKHGGTRTFEFDSAGPSSISVEGSSKSLAVNVLP